MPLRRLLPLLAASAAACALAPAAQAAATEAVPGEVVVRRAGEEPRVLRGVDDVAATVRRLRRRDGVAYAAPNPVARASAFIPDDPGFGEGWQAVQWNFLEGNGVNAPVAWQHAIDAGASAARPTSTGPASARATTSSAATASPTTRTATAPTSRARSPSRRTTGAG